MTGARSETPTPPTVATAATPEGPPDVTLTASTAAWLYGAVLERQVLRGQPRDPEVRRHIDALRKALVAVLPDEAVDGELDAVHALERGERRVA